MPVRISNASLIAAPGQAQEMAENATVEAIPAQPSDILFGRLAGNFEINPGAPANDAEAARFLTQATFGPTTGEVLYIGKAANFRTRYHNHNKPGGGLDRAEAFCGCSVKMRPYELESDPKVRDRNERRDVRIAKPSGNQIFTGRRRLF